MSTKNTNRTNKKRQNNSTSHQKSGNKGSTGQKPKSQKPRSKRPAVKGAKEEEILHRPKQLAKLLEDHFQMKVRLRNADFYIDSITGKRNNVYSYWDSRSLRVALTITNLTSKLSGMQPLKSDDDMVKEFIETQTEPVINPFIISMTRDVIHQWFSDLDLDAILKRVKDPSRKKLVTQGASWPSNLTPVYTNDQNNMDLLVGMSVGEAIFQPDFLPTNVFVPVAGGKFTSVPKNYKVNRGITIAPSELIDEQDVVSSALRDHITILSRSTNHIVQFDDQSVQWKLLIEGNATLDLSSASDRVYRKVLKAVWPEFYDRFEFLFPKDILLPDGRIEKLTCVGTQGFPLTFTLMSILVGAVVQANKVTTRPSSNYGDDVIVSEDDFESVYTALECVGLKINRSKTHKSSDGFLESCGMDVMFTDFGPRVVTPIYLRGHQDVHFVQFMHQMCSEGMIDASSATQILDRMKVDYFAFEHDYQITEFHFPHGEVRHIPAPNTFNYNSSRYEVVVPCMVSEIDSIRGLSGKDSGPVLELLKIDAALKDPSINESFKRGSDPVARPYRLYDIQARELYKLYIALNNSSNHTVVSYVILAKEHNVPLRSLLYYVFITSEMQKYRYSTRTVDFSSYTVKDFDIQDVIHDVLNITHEVKYPIYRYKTKKGTKRIEHPLSLLHLKKKD